MDELRHVPYVSKIGDLCMVVCQRSIVVPNTERINHTSVAACLVRVSVPDAQHLAEGVVDHEVDRTSLLLPRRLQRIVIRVAAMGQDIYILIVSEPTIVVLV